MKHTKFKRILLLGLIAVFSASTMLLAAGCDKSGGGNNKILNPEVDPLVIASESFDTVFNPFFYTSGPDGEVVGQTQLGMLTTDESGNLVAGADETSVALDYSVVTHGSESTPEDYYTDYYFVIKNGIKFSDGADLTIKDVLFNLYMYLDPIYSGSSTMYSIDIQGLKAYRTQTEDPNEQDSVDSYFATEAGKKINAIVNWCNDETVSEKKSLFNVTEEKYIRQVEKLFKEELTSDWNSAEGSIESYKHYGFTQAWQVFLYMEGKITVTMEKDGAGNKTYKVDYNGYDKREDKSKDALIDLVFNDMIGQSVTTRSYQANLKSVITSWATATAFRTYMIGEVKSEYYDGNISVRTISGISALKGDSIPAGGGKTKNFDEEHDILKIRINGIDPKAIYSFGFSVAPMHYYSNCANEFSLEQGKENFGVKTGNSEFMSYVRSKSVPMGAGAYKAQYNDYDRFYSENMARFERNTYFNTVGDGSADSEIYAPKIKFMRMLAISNTQLYDAVSGANPTVHFSSPNVTSKIREDATAKKTEGKLDYVLAPNLGYGYIGINAKYVPDILVRRAIMYAMDTSQTLQYYGAGDLATLVYRSMSSESWAYPEGCQSYYTAAYKDGEVVNALEEGITDAKFNDEAAKEMIKKLVMEEGQYMLNSSGVLYKGSDVLKYTFTLAGNNEDHPTYATFRKAADILNSVGFDITVVNDSQALTKLATGSLSIWAAAWSSALDPDMYQVYHKDSQASSVNNWGYPDILADQDKYFTEFDIIDTLSILIDDARKTNDRSERKAIYSQALDRVMDLAVELPTYQRKNMFAWNNNVIDTATLEKATAYHSPISKIWKVDFVKNA